MLEAKKLQKNYIVKERKGIFKRKSVKSVPAVKEISLKIEPGKIVGLLGSNGAGKTTTIKMLSGIIEPTSGQLIIDEVKDAVKDYMKIKEKINLVSGGERNIYWRLSAQENLEYFGRLYGLKGKELKERIDYILDKVKLSDVRNTPVEKYSKGMKQRLQIARGLINDPKYIFLDEPTLGLDITIAKEFREYIKYLARSENKGILLTTHYIGEAEELCDYIYIIDKGIIISEGTPEGLKDKLNLNKETVFVVNTIPIDIEMQIRRVVNNDEIIIKIEDAEQKTIRVLSRENYTVEIINLLSNKNISVLEIKTMEPNLEDVLFKTIMGGDNVEENNRSNLFRNNQTASKLV